MKMKEEIKKYFIEEHGLVLEKGVDEIIKLVEQRIDDYINGCEEQAQMHLKEYPDSELGVKDMALEEWNEKHRLPFIRGKIYALEILKGMLK